VYIWEMKNLYVILVRKIKLPTVKPTHNQEENIGMNLEETELRACKGFIRLRIGFSIGFL
jgi:hypothetical protein